MDKLKITAFKIVDKNENLFDFRTLLTKPNEIGIVIGYNKSLSVNQSPLYFISLILENNEILRSECHEKIDLFYDPYCSKFKWYKILASIHSEFIKISASNVISKINIGNGELIEICVVDGYIKKEFLNEDFGYELDSEEKRIIFGKSMKFNIDFSEYYDNGTSKIIKKEILNCWSEFKPVIVQKELYFGDGYRHFTRMFYSENKRFKSGDIPVKAEKLMLKKLKKHTDFVVTSEDFNYLLIINKKFLINETLIESYEGNEDELYDVGIKFINKDISVPTSKRELKEFVSNFLEELKQYEEFDGWYLSYSLVI